MFSYPKDWSEKKRALEEAAKNFSEVDCAVLVANAEHYRGLWLAEQRRADAIRSLAGCPAGYVEMIADFIAETLRKPIPSKE